MRQLFLISSVIICTACLPSTHVIEEGTETGTGVKIEAPKHDSEAPEITETGSLLSTERLLETGVLEIGSSKAPHTLLIFTEHNCNYCRTFHKEQLPILISEFINSGELRIQISPFVLNKYANSKDLAQAAICASKQGKGLIMHNELFSESNRDLKSINSYAKEIELDEAEFEICMNNTGSGSTVSKMQDWAKSLGVKYVPTFFLDGEKFEGLQYYSDLRGRIEKVLED